MTDQKPDLVVPDRRIVSIDEARNDLAKPRAGPRTPGASNDFVTRKEMMMILVKINDGISDASLAVGQKVYDQIGDETAELLERMHANIRQEILAEIDARSWRGRIRRRWLQFRDWARGYLIEMGVLSPLAAQPNVRLVESTEVLDPGAQRAAALAELRDLIAGAGPNMSIELPDGTTPEDAQQIEAELRAEREQAVADATPP